jgi:hypothetical protein
MTDVRTSPDPRYPQLYQVARELVELLGETSSGHVGVGARLDRLLTDGPLSESSLATSARWRIAFHRRPGGLAAGHGIAFELGRIAGVASQVAPELESAVEALLPDAVAAV